MDNKLLSKKQVNIILKSIVETSKNVVIFALDCDYRYVVFNPSHFATMKHIWGCEIAAGNNMLDYIKDTEDRLKAKKNFDRALAGESFNLVEEYGDTELDRRYYNIVYNPVPESNGGIIGVSVILIDITEETKAKQALKVSEATLKKINAAKDRFFNIIAHDLRNPFNVLLNFAEILSVRFKQLDDIKKEEIINEIYRSSRNTSLLLENLLEWSMTQTDRVSYNPHNYSLDGFFVEAVTQAQSAANNKNIKLSFDIKENIMIYADKYMIDTILRNLISNALKFTRRGGEVNISGIKNGNEIIIAIKDNGIGMSSEIKEMLFDISAKKKKLGTENEAGTGIGLSLCKEFVDKHNGRIWAESEIGKGSIFYISIPSNLN